MQQGFIVRALLELEGKARTPDNRIPLNLSIVLDRSGSMAGAKLAAARDDARHQVAPEDTLTIKPGDRHWPNADGPTSPLPPHVPNATTAPDTPYLMACLAASSVGEQVIGDL